MIPKEKHAPRQAEWWVTHHCRMPFRLVHTHCIPSAADGIQVLATLYWLGDIRFPAWTELEVVQPISTYFNRSKPSPSNYGMQSYANLKSIGRRTKHLNRPAQSLIQICKSSRRTLWSVTKWLQTKLHFETLPCPRINENSSGPFVTSLQEPAHAISQ